jgi:hypothetical protein
MAPHVGDGTFQRTALDELIARMKEIVDAVSDRGKGVRRRGERRAWAPDPEEMIFRCITWFP